MIETESKNIKRLPSLKGPTPRVLPSGASVSWVYLDNESINWNSLDYIFCFPFNGGFSWTAVLWMIMKSKKDDASIRPYDIVITRTKMIRLLDVLLSVPTFYHFLLLSTIFCYSLIHIHTSHSTHTSHTSRHWWFVFLRSIYDDSIRSQEHRSSWDSVF